MLLIAIVAFIATTAFYRQAKLAGLYPGKAASVPFIAAGMFLVGAYFLTRALVHIAIALNASDVTGYAINWMMNLFLLLAYLAFIGRHWVTIQNATRFRSSS